MKWGQTPVRVKLYRVKVCVDTGGKVCIVYAVYIHLIMVYIC
jgi:hypothetical protein